MEYRVKRTPGNQWNSDSVRALRAHLGLTQQQTISEWERGMYRPRGTSRTLLGLLAERAGFEYGTAHQTEAADGLPPEDPSEDY
jgi:hypothetical protein